MHLFKTYLAFTYELKIFKSFDFLFVNHRYCWWLLCFHGCFVRLILIYYVNIFVSMENFHFHLLLGFNSSPLWNTWKELFSYREMFVWIDLAYVSLYSIILFPMYYATLCCNDLAILFTHFFSPMHWSSPLGFICNGKMSVVENAFVGISEWQFITLHLAESPRRSYRKMDGLILVNFSSVL